MSASRNTGAIISQGLSLVYFFSLLKHLTVKAIKFLHTEMV